MTAQRHDSTGECELHSQLMETLGGLRADVGWLKKAFWSIPAMIVMVSMAIGGYVISMEKRISVCETQIANQLSLGDIPRWTKTSPKSK
jgi:hypothetical protein